jgi:hypothetical protein
MTVFLKTHYPPTKLSYVHLCLVFDLVVLVPAAALAFRIVLLHRFSADRDAQDGVLAWAASGLLHTIALLWAQDVLSPLGRSCRLSRLSPLWLLVLGLFRLSRPQRHFRD